MNYNFFQFLISLFCNKLYGKEFLKLGSEHYLKYPSIKIRIIGYKRFHSWKRAYTLWRIEPVDKNIEFLNILTDKNFKEINDSLAIPEWISVDCLDFDRK